MHAVPCLSSASGPAKVSPDTGELPPTARMQNLLKLTSSAQRMAPISAATVGGIRR